MKDCGGHFHGKHLKRSLDYVMNPEKTQDGRLVGAINCQVDSAFEQMKATKRKFGKVDKRQGYHIILSFKEDEVNPDTAFEITRRFVEEYLGKSYEAVYVVHDNTAHVHSHIVFNSVSFVDGKKYRYEKGDWAKYIQPITNKLCQEYGLSIIDVDDGSKEKEHESYKDWSEYREGSFVWADMIKRDLDSCILQAGNYEQFLELLSDKGYEVKQGKYLAVKPQGMTRFRRCKTLGDMYSTADLLRDNQGNIYVDAEGNVKANFKSEDIKLGSVFPKCNMAWRNDFRWKNLNFGFMLSARIGGIVYSATQAALDLYGVSEVSAAARDRGGVSVNGGDIIDAQKWYSVIGSESGIPQYYTYSATNLRLQEASIGYTIPKNKLWGVADITVSLVGRNLWMIYCKAPFDPESVASTGNYYQGIDNFMVPSARSMGFNVRFKF